MENVDNNVARAYKVQVGINGKYAHVIVRNRFLHDQPPKSSFEAKRKSHCTNLDLWVDGSIYPIDPTTDKRPKFRCIRSLLEYVGDGESGMLGYIENVGRGMQDSSAHMTVMKVRLEELQKSHTTEHNKCRDLQTEVESLRLNLVRTQELYTRTHDSYISQVRGLQSENDSLKSECATNRQKHDLLVDSLTRKATSDIDSLQAELSLTKKTLATLQRTLHRIVKTPQGFRQQVRPRKDLIDLSPKGGHAKTQRRLARSIIAPATVKKLQKENAAKGVSRRRMHGDKDSQTQNGRAFASILIDQDRS